MTEEGGYTKQIGTKTDGRPIWCRVTKDGAITVWHKAPASPGMFMIAVSKPDPNGPPKVTWCTGELPPEGIDIEPNAEEG